MPENMSKTDKQYYLRRLGSLDIEQSSFRSHWKDLSEYIEPRRGNFFISDRNKGDKRHNKIINSRATQALRNSEAGTFAGIMSPTRRWFKFETLDQDLMASMAVKEWLYKCENILYAIFLDSNLYNVAPVTIGEALLFGTGAMSQIDDFDTVAHFDPHTIGSYYIGTNPKGEVDTFVKKRERTVKQIVEEFGMENVSPTIADHYKMNNYDVWYSVCQFIDPNPNYNEARADEDRFMKWRSAWFELGHVSSSAGVQTATSSVFTDNKFLRKKGFQEFPIHCIRWSVTGDDIYGTNCPGMVTLGDVKSLQIMEKRKAQAIDKMVNPPLKGPPTLTDVPITSLPGGVTIYDQVNDKEGLSPLYQFEPRVQELRADINAIEQRINEAFFVDLFLAISTMEGVQPKNQLELAQRNAERLLMLGPPLERLQQDFLGKIVQRTFQQALRAEILPPPPSELSGQALNIGFISALAQAQRVNEVTSIERITGFISSLAAVKPDVLDKLNTDEVVDKYSQFIGGPPTIIVDQEEVDQVRQARAEQAKAAQQAQMQQMQADTGASVAGAVKDIAGAANEGTVQRG